MAHPTTDWAHLYGLPDPGVPAAAVLDGRPDGLRLIAARVRQIAGTAEECRQTAHRAAAAVQAGWTAQAPRAAVSSLATFSRRLADVGAAIGAAIDDYAADVERCCQQVTYFYDSADTLIDARDLRRSFPEIPAIQVFPQMAERRGLVQRLYVAMAQQSQALDDAALRLYARLDVDPRDGLPGAVDGPRASVPAGAGATDARNRARLVADLVSASRQRREFAAAIQRELTEAAAAHPGPVQLLEYDPTSPSGQGGVAIALGAVADADTVAVLVPGVGNSPSDLSDTLDVASGLVSAASAAAPGTSTAAVVWLGYNAPLSWTADPKASTSLGELARAVPDSLIAANGIDAVGGGAQLATFCGQLRDMMDTSAGLTLIGHSYGSTVVSQAAVRLPRYSGVDDIVLLASPGAGPGPTNADDYSAVPADHVYALAFPQDPVPSSGLDAIASLVSPPPPGGPYGADPDSPGFGAQVIDVPSGVTLLHEPNWLTTAASAGAAVPLGIAGVDPLNDINQHALTNYLGATALTAVAAVVVGQYSKVPVRSQR